MQTEMIYSPLDGPFVTATLEKKKGCIELEIRLGALNWYKSERMHKLQWNYSSICQKKIHPGMFSFWLYENSSSKYSGVAEEVGKGYKPQVLAHKPCSNYHDLEKSCFGGQFIL